MLCTARSRLGLALISTCQSPVMRLTFNVWSAGSPKVARPSRVELVPDPAVREGGPGGDCRSARDSGSLLSLQPREKARSARAMGERRSDDIGASKVSGSEVTCPVCPTDRAVYLMSSKACPLIM